jgi:hypothetical protein
MNKRLNSELAEPSEQSIELVNELLELEAQNAIYINLLLCYNEYIN